MRRKWQFLYDASVDCLYHYTMHGYTQHEKLRSDYDQEPAQDIIEPMIPKWAVLVNVIVYDHTYRIQRGWQQSGAPQLPNAEKFDSFFDLLPTMEPWEWQLLFDVEFLCAEQTLWEALTQQVCTIALDRSAANGKGSFAWVISDKNGDILAECKGPVPGAKVTSFRAEGYGILAVLRFLIGMNTVHNQVYREESSENPQEVTPSLGLLVLTLKNLM